MSDILLYSSIILGASAITKIFVSSKMPQDIKKEISELVENQKSLYQSIESIRSSINDLKLHLARKNII